MHFSAKCNSGRIAIQWFHIKRYLDYQYTKFQLYTFRVQNNCVPINTKARKPRLPEEKRTNFIENLNRIKIQSLLANITQTSQTTDSLSKEKVNTLRNKFSESFYESANSCNNYNNGINTANNNKHPLFGYQCAKSRKTYHRAKKMHAKHTSSASNASVVSASKMYKKKLNYFIGKHKKTHRIN